MTSVFTSNTFRLMARRRALGLSVGSFFFTAAFAALAETPSAVISTNTITPALPGSLPDTSASVVRVFGALILVIGIFLGGVWLFRNWQRFTVQKGGGPRLNVLEVR